MSTDVVRYSRPAPSLRDDMELASALAGAGIFGSPAEVLVRILAGRELGFGPVAALENIWIVDGKIVVGAHIRAASIRGSGRYDFCVDEHTDTVCAITFLRRDGDAWQPLGTERITLEGATAKGWHLSKAGKVKPAWITKSKNMLYARCMTDGYRFHTPDLSGGISTYDPDELDVAGPEVEAEFTVAPAAQTDDPHMAAVTAPATPLVPNPPAPQTATPTTITPEQRQALVAMFQQHKRTPEEAQVLLASVGCKVLDQLPASRYEWAARILTDGQATPPQCDRIVQLVEERKLGWDRLNARLQEKYGVERVKLLTGLQADEVIDALEAAMR